MSLLQLGAWNPLDGWLWLEKSFLVEVLERIGPIYIDDYQRIYDVNETASFNFRFSAMGSKTCISIDWDDGSRYLSQICSQFPVLQAPVLWQCRELQAEVSRCKCLLLPVFRFAQLTENDVTPVDYTWKQFNVDHMYIVRNFYTVREGTMRGLCY
jgi:hypothetical protein